MKDSTVPCKNMSWELRGPTPSNTPKNSAKKEGRLLRGNGWVHSLRGNLSMKCWHITDGSRLMHILWELLSFFFWGERRSRIFLRFQAVFFGRKAPQNDLSRVPHCGFKGWNLQLANPLQQGLLALKR